MIATCIVIHRQSVVCLAISNVLDPKSDTAIMSGSP